MTSRILVVIPAKAYGYGVLNSDNCTTNNCLLGCVLKKEIEM
jgi:hypothetical protein